MVSSDDDESDDDIVVSVPQPSSSPSSPTSPSPSFLFSLTEENSIIFDVLDILDVGSFGVIRLAFVFAVEIVVVITTGAIVKLSTKAKSLPLSLLYCCCSNDRSRKDRSTIATQYTILGSLAIA